MSLRQLAIALAGAGLLVAAVPAYAGWTGAASGSAHAAAAAAPQPIIVSAGAAAARPAYPTGTPTGSVSASLRNPNPYRVHVGRLVLDPTAGSGGFSANAAGCGLTFTPPAGGGWDVPANGTTELELDGTLAMAASAPGSCARLAVDVHLEAAP
jgi:hypothetical protein